MNSFNAGILREGQKDISDGRFRNNLQSASLASHVTPLEKRWGTDAYQAYPERPMEQAVLPSGSQVTLQKPGSENHKFYTLHVQESLSDVSSVSGQSAGQSAGVVVDTLAYVSAVHRTVFAVVNNEVRMRFPLSGCQIFQKYYVTGCHVRGTQWRKWNQLSPSKQTIYKNLAQDLKKLIEETVKAHYKEHHIKYVWKQRDLSNAITPCTKQDSIGIDIHVRSDVLQPSANISEASLESFHDVAPDPLHQRKDIGSGSKVKKRDFNKHILMTVDPKRQQVMVDWRRPIFHPGSYGQHSDLQKSRWKNATKRLKSDIEQHIHEKYPSYTIGYNPSKNPDQNFYMEAMDISLLPSFKDLEVIS